MAQIDRTEAEGLLAYIDASPSPFHAVADAAGRLETAGFTELPLDAAWSAMPSRAFVRRGGALVAWAAAEEGQPAPAAPFRLIGAHTDSPNLRIKPQPDTGRAGWRQLGVEVYGGALLNSWLDRDLGFSGRVAVAPDRSGDPPDLRLVEVDRPVLRVPQLAIHLDRNVNEGGLVLNRQAHLTPVWGLGRPDPAGFRTFLADELEVGAEQVLAWDLMVHDLNPGTSLGRDDELIAAPRIDNLASCFAAVGALLDWPGAAAGAPGTVPVVCLYDHEEVGSTSATGADGALLATVLERIVIARDGSRDHFLAALGGSICVSADGAHATHPNYADRHEPDHLVVLNEGPVVKVNVNQRYATDAATSAAFVAAADAAGVPTQRFVTRSDLPCGSTIGPLTSARLGVPTVDVGIGQLSMHSARELCGADDPAYFRRALASFLSPPPR